MDPETTVARNGSAAATDAALAKIDGTWKQGAGSLPLVLTRQKQ